MIEFKDIKFDCELYTGYKPCVHGNECLHCPFYQSRSAEETANALPPPLNLSALPNNCRILIIKTGALGDVLRTTTLLSELKLRFPEAHITWLTATSAVPLLANNPGIDTLLDFTNQNIGFLKSENFDFLINLEKEKEPLALSNDISAGQKAGYKATQWNTATVYNLESVYALRLGISDKLKFFINTKSYPQIICEMAGLDFHRCSYILNLSERGNQRKNEIYSLIPAEKKHLPIIALNTGCGDVFKTKQWTVEGWSATASRLIQSENYNVILLGGKAETALNTQILNSNPGLINTGVDNTLEEFIGIVDACDILVSSDSLGMHIGIARNKKVVALFGSTSHQEIDLFDNGKKIITDFSCSPCYLKSCDKNPTCMEAMSSDKVCDAIEELLGADDAESIQALPNEEIKHHSADRPSPSATLLYLITSLLLLFPVVSLFKPATLASLRAHLAIKSPYIQLDNEEGALLFQAKEMALGNSIYHNLSDYPYVVGTYTPLFMWINSWMINLNSPSFSSGRSLVWGSALGIALIMSLIIALKGRHLIAALLCPLLFLATYEVHDWIAYYRVDFPAIFLSLLGLLIFSVNPRNSAALILSALFMVAGLYTKQIVLAAPLAALTYLVFYDRKSLIKFLTAFAGFGFIPFILLMIKTDGEFFNNIVKYNMNKWTATELVIWGKHVIRIHKWLFLAGCFSIILYPVLAFIYHKRSRAYSVKIPYNFPEFFDPLLLYAMFSLINFFAIAKAGSAPNYLLEPIIGWSLIVCLTLCHSFQLIKTRRNSPVFFLAFSCALLLSVLLFTHSLPYSNNQYVTAMFNPNKNPQQTDFQAYNHIQRLINKEKDSYSDIPIFNIRAKRSIYFQPFIMSELARQGAWNEDNFVRDIEQGKFPVVVSQIDLTGAEPTNLYTPRMLTAFRDRYEIADQITTHRMTYYIFKPRPANIKKTVDPMTVSQAGKATAKTTLQNII